MVNHPNRSSASRAGKELAEAVMTSLSGRAGVRINGQMVQWNTLEGKNRLHIGDSFVPVSALQSNLTEHEVHELESLPSWNGNNEYEISSRALNLVGVAIRRYNHTTDHNLNPDQLDKLNGCNCSECLKKRVTER